MRDIWMVGPETAVARVMAISLFGDGQADHPYLRPCHSVENRQRILRRDEDVGYRLDLPRGVAVRATLKRGIETTLRDQCLPCGWALKADGNDAPVLPVLTASSDGLISVGDNEGTEECTWSQMDNAGGGRRRAARYAGCGCHVTQPLKIVGRFGEAVGQVMRHFERFSLAQPAGANKFRQIGTVRTPRHIMPRGN